MMVLSDGYPAAMSSMVKMRDHLRRVVSDIEDSGTDIVGIGIQSEAVNHFYTNHVVVHRISDLEGEVMGQLSKILLGERVELDHSKLIDRAV
jgi:cobalamin biosynthesis protein CobT